MSLFLNQDGGWLASGILLEDLGRRLFLCRGRLDVMHLDGNEANGEPDNLAFGCSIMQ
jgi:hypothetical protein